MKKIIIFIFSVSLLLSFQNSKIENLMGTQKYNNYNKLLSKIFTQDKYSIYDILSKLKNNGLLDLFFNKAKIIHTKFIFKGGSNIFESKILNDALKSLGYYYFYPSEITKQNGVLTLNIEFKSEHFIDPVSVLDEMKSRGCEIQDVSKQNGNFKYVFDCSDAIVKDAKLLTNKNHRYIKARGVYWFDTDGSFSRITIRTKRIDYWHPSIWFYDDKLDLLNNVKINQKTRVITLNIPASCKYIKITDIYSGENFKRGIIVKGIK